MQMLEGELNHEVEAQPRFIERSGGRRHDVAGGWRVEYG
jgi:hypothetical protein